MIKIHSNFDYEKEYTDSITGLKGKLVAITKWNHGCVRVALQPKIKEDGTVPDAVWVDEPQIEGYIQPNLYNAESDAKPYEKKEKFIDKVLGGPRPNQKHYPDPKR